MTKKKIFFVILVAALVLAGYFGGSYFLTYLNTKHMIENGNALTTAKAVLLKKNYDTGLSLVNATLKNSPTPAQRGLALIILAENLWGRNQGNDRDQALQTYKQMAADEGLPPKYRALALNDISIIIRNHDLAYYQAHFTEAPYSTFIPSNGSAFMKQQEAYVGVLRLSDSIFPSSFAEYAMAANYYARLISAKLVTASTSVEMAHQMQRYVKAGDSRNDQQMYAPFLLIVAYTNRAVALESIGKILKVDNSANVEQAYKLAISTADNVGPLNTDSDAVYWAALSARFLYANFLNVSFQGKRTADIVSLLKPFSGALDNRPGTVATWLRDTFSDNESLKSGSLELAKISPEFKQLLAQLPKS